MTTRQVIPALPVGHGALEIAGSGGRSVVVGRHAASPLRLLCPRNAGTAAWTYTSSFGGGLVDGDDVRLDVTVGACAQALVATQASTKAYPAEHGARQTLAAGVAAAGLLVVLSDPLVPFAGARVESLVDVELVADASVVAVESLAAGRVARGERWQAARCQTRLRVRRDGQLLLDEALLLDPAHGDVAQRMGRFDAVATVALSGPAVARAARDLVADRRAPTADLLELVAPLDGGGCVLRIAATSTAILSNRVREALSFVAPLLGDDPFTRRW